MKDRVNDITLDYLGVVDLHLRSQERPPVSGRVPDKCPDISFSVLEIERRVNMGGNITLKPLGVANLDFRNQELPPMSGRVPDKCPDQSFKVWEIEWSVVYQIVCIL